MFYAIFTIHILICLVIIGIVLVQQGKGAEAGAVFGSSSDSVLGAGSGASFITKFTTSMAIAFMVTSILLVKVYSGHQETRMASDTDVLEGSIVNQAEEAKVETETEAVAEEVAETVETVKEEVAETAEVAKGKVAEAAETVQDEVAKKVEATKEEMTEEATEGTK